MIKLNTISHLHHFVDCYEWDQEGKSLYRDGALVDPDGKFYRKLLLRDGGTSDLYQYYLIRMYQESQNV